MQTKKETVFGAWLDTLVDEKGYDRETTFDVDGPEWGLNIIPLQVVIDAIKQAPVHEQKGIKSMLVRIDFANGDCLDYFRHLSQALAL